MMFNQFFAFLLFFAVSFGLCAERPNVIVIMTDDQGYGEMSCHGNPYLQTPHLDRLHSQSVRLANFHATPMCTPTRGELLTGLSAVRNGAINVSSGRALLRPELPTMADFFSEAGYATGSLGKWHLGANLPYRPEDRGFEETVWFPSSHIGSVPDYWGNDYFDDTYIRNGKQEAFEGYCTDIFFDEAMGFMRRSSEAGRPFFTYLSTHTPPSPFIAKEEDYRRLDIVLEDPAFDHLEARAREESVPGMMEAEMGTVTIVAILAIATVAALVASRARSGITGAFREFCRRYDLEYSPNCLSEFMLPGAEAAWFLNIKGAHNTLVRDVCKGVYQGFPFTFLKYQYAPGYANYVAVFVFRLPSCRIPQALLWPKASRSDLGNRRGWDLEVTGHEMLLYREDPDRLPPGFRSLAAELASRQGLWTTRMEFINEYAIFVPQEQQEAPNESFTAYLDLLVEVVRETEARLGRKSLDDHDLHS